MSFFRGGGYVTGGVCDFLLHGHGGLLCAIPSLPRLSVSFYFHSDTDTYGTKYTQLTLLARLHVAQRPYVGMHLIYLFYIKHPLYICIV